MVADGGIESRSNTMSAKPCAELEAAKSSPLWQVTDIPATSFAFNTGNGNGKTSSARPQVAKKKFSFDG